MMTKTTTTKNNSFSLTFLKNNYLKIFFKLFFWIGKGTFVLHTARGCVVCHMQKILSHRYWSSRFGYLAEPWYRLLLNSIIFEEFGELVLFRLVKLLSGLADLIFGCLLSALVLQYIFQDTGTLRV